MQSDWSLTFHPVENDALLCYSKRAGDDRVLVVVNLDPREPQAGFVDVDLSALGLDVGVAYTVQDLLTESRYTWYGSRNFVRLDPHVTPAHVFTIS
jgi:starch synthase (maltosyl-transferring)